ncbi:DUF3592 domain-containing protein [Legionella sp. W05-934-2]|jgi:hypothetical protein|uniref:DUF3592 domain-containing protein n=1 Tax=Legionella sp. W05-934-2 TaxID=1198649 RepID=UPI003462256B
MLASTIISLIWIVILIVFFIFFFNHYRRLKNISRWPITEGKVVHFTMEEQNENYWPSISYQYQVNGQTHESEHFFADTAHYSPQTPRAKRLAYDIAQAYLKEQPVVVHYNPLAPEEAVLDVKVPIKLIAIMVVLFALMLTEVILLLLK